jgi:EAL domain-containing protein (putative c-di-GMP-specific phosphodiesterase class I)
VVTKGVKILEQRECLVELGCDLLQGYLIARPRAEVTI